MKILLVEDDKQKGDRLVEFLAHSFPDSILTWAKSISTGIDAIDDMEPSLFILDMSLPTFEEGRSLHAGGRQHNFGGMDILAYMKAINIICPTIIITQFPEFEDKGFSMSLAQLDANLERDFKGIYRGLIHYKHNEESWMVKLSEKIGEIWNERFDH